MKWDKQNKKRLRDLIEARLKEICPFGLSMDEAYAMHNANPSLMWDDLLKIDKDRHREWIASQQQFFDDFGILRGLPKAAKTKNYIILDVFMPLAIKATKISIPKDVAEKFLVFGMP
jgi:hypothetical protein